jgi:hypothetical protein
LTTYLADTLRGQYTSRGLEPPGPTTRAYRDYFPTATSGRVGCIYLASQPRPASELVYVCFTAATSSMSRLFQHSASIQHWFLILSQAVHAHAAFLDMEAAGYRFFYWQSRERAATLPGDLSLGPGATGTEQAMAEVCWDYT